MLAAHVRAVEQQKLYSSVLREAAHAVGEARLAAFLGVEPPQLRRWLRGAEIPFAIFLASLDVIADGPFAPREASVRVAHIREEDKTHRTREAGPASMRATTGTAAGT